MLKEIDIYILWLLFAVLNKIWQTLHTVVVNNPYGCVLSDLALDLKWSWSSSWLCFDVNVTAFCI